MYWLEVKYLNLLRNQLKNYKEISLNPLTVNFRCPLCGDSQKNQYKSRAYIYEKNGKLHFFCHNCGASSFFWIFLSEQSSPLYAQYKLDRLRSLGISPKVVKQEPEFLTNTKFNDHNFHFGVCLNNCKDNDQVLHYANNRKIPHSFYNSLYACDDIRSITSQIDKYKNLKIEKRPGLVIPFFDQDKNFSYICIRSIDQWTSFRYLVLEVNDLYPKLWGLEYIDWKKRVYVFEGPIDAMCCPNSLALSGSVGGKSIQYISSCINNLQDICFVYDNEIFSNSQILQQMKMRIKEGFSVVIFDKFFPGKDANEVITNQTMTFQSLQLYLNERTFNGLRATIEIARLKKPKNR